MPSPPHGERGAVRADERGASTLLNDRWLCAVTFITAVFYIALILIRPTGEGWGRGWNLIAFLIYSAPTLLVAGFLALWRRGKTTGHMRKLASFVALGALVFPVICVVAIRAKA